MKFKKDILVKYLTYNYYCNTKFQEDTIKKVDVRIGVSSIFFTLLSYKKNNIDQNLVYGNIFYTMEDLDNTIYNLKINKIYDEEKEFTESNIKDYLNVFYIEFISLLKSFVIN